MVSRSGDDAIIRHILRIPQITDVESNAAIAKMDTIRTRLVDGSLSFGEAVDKYSEDDNAKFTAGMMLARDGSNYLQIDELDKNLVLLLKNTNLKPGEYSRPTVFTDDRGKKGVRIVYLMSKSQPHQENMRDDYNFIAQRALDEKKGIILQKWFQARIATYYIMIDKDYEHCPNLAKWQTKQFAKAN